MTTYALTLVTATANLRTDLNDTNNAAYRWVDAQLQRALDRALERLSSVEPDLEAIQVATIPGSRYYPVPSGSLWIDRVEYPSGQWPPNYPAFSEYRSPILLAPTVAPIVTPYTAAGSLLTAGAHTYGTTWVDPAGGETTGSPTVAVTTSAGQAAQLSIPTFPDNVVGMNVYRSAAGTTTPLKLVGQAYASSTYFADAIADGSLGVTMPVANTTGGADTFRLEIPPSDAPIDATSYYLTVRYAKKHELDTGGTTLPERHWDTLYLGGMAAAIEQYLSSINDNFVYADGQLRDRVDDTKSVDSWRTFYNTIEADFAQRLKQIRDEQIQSARFTPAWGDKPLRWERV